MFQGQEPEAMRDQLKNYAQYLVNTFHEDVSTRAAASIFKNVEVKFPCA
jgi:hypothetical protein